MAKATGKTVRAQRIEVTDDKGRVRLVLGRLGDSGHGVYGLAVRDDRGRDRCWVVQDGAAAEIGLDHDGNMVIAMRVSDDGRADLHVAE